jgi:hypothetical protein
MDPTLLKITAAALLHDIGKFADRAALGVSEQYMLNNADLYQPFQKKTARHTHPHAVYTAAFIETLKEMLPPEFNAQEWGDGESLINLAAGHHRPEENPLRWIVTEADRLSSGWERYKGELGEEEAAVDWGEYQKTRLAAILAELSIPKENNGPRKASTPARHLGYALQELSPAIIFPRPLEEVSPADRQKAKGEYLQLFEGFKKNLGRLAHRLENLELWLEHFDSLLMIYTAMIPALRAGAVEASRDVSLYDHSRTTAALAAALYLYHRDHATLTVPVIQSSAEKKFLFISGDFYGTQDFIFSAGGETRRYRAKLLRGRSFAVSLISELAADLVCRKMGLPFLSLVLNAAGKFTILAPNTDGARQAVQEAEREINRLARTFTDRPEGLESLGVLQADVDNLGLLMTCGLPERQFTLSRLATLSRQLNAFFCLHLPHLLMTTDDFQDIYTVFAGGDDLFLIGPWNRIIPLARVIQEKFTAYVGGNPEVHLSAGITLKKAHTPIDQLARSTKEALDQAKGGDKNSLNLFGETVPWAQVGDLLKIRETLAQWLANGWFTPVMLYRLNEFIRLAGEEKQLTAGRPVHLDDLACLKWRAHLAYFTARNVARDPKDGTREQAVREVHEQLALWLKTHGGALRLPLWDLLYERRR